MQPAWIFGVSVVMFWAAWSRALSWLPPLVKWQSLKLKDKLYAWAFQTACWEFVLWMLKNHPGGEGRGHLFIWPGMKSRLKCSVAFSSVQKFSSFHVVLSCSVFSLPNARADRRKHTSKKEYKGREPLLSFRRPIWLGLSGAPCVMCTRVRHTTCNIPSSKFVGFSFCTGSSSVLTSALWNLSAGSNLLSCVVLLCRDTCVHCRGFAMAKSTGIAVRSAFYQFVGRNPEFVPFKQIQKNVRWKKMCICKYVAVWIHNVLLFLFSHSPMYALYYMRET